MPQEKLLRWIIISGLRQMVELISIERIIIAAVFKFVTEAAADFDAVVRGHRDIAAVEESVDVATEQKAVIDFMWAAISVRFNVGGLEGGQRMLLRNSTCAAVSIRDANEEFHGSLTYLFLPGMPVPIIAQLPGA